MKDDFFKKLDQELNALELPMSEKLKNTPIQARSEENEAQPVRSNRQPTFPAWLKAHRVWVTAAACSLAVVFIGGITLSSLPNPENQTEYSSYLYLDINPSVAVLLDGNGKVAKLVSRNEDGDRLLKDSTFKNEVLGADASVAVKQLADRAAKMGYIDLLSDGSNGDFNEIRLSLFGDSTVSKERLTELQSVVTDYFCERGVFVYVDVSQTVLEDFKENIEAFSVRPESYLDYTVTQESESISETFFFEYAEDLLKETLEKYDLYTQISTLETQIEADTGSSYWLSSTESEDAKTMTVALEKFYHLYDEDFKKADNFIDNLAIKQNFFLLESVYHSQAEIAEELRLLLQNGLTRENFTLSEFAKFSLFSTVLGYGEDLFSSLSTLFNAIEENASNAHVAIKEYGDAYADDLYARHEKYFNAISQNNGIDSNAYQEFLDRIGKNN